VFSGRLRQDAPRRLAETSRFVQAVSMPGGMALGADGFAITLRVRLMHAKVRTLLRRSPRWDTAAWGEPINQVDMAGTILLFSLVLLDGLRAFGLRIPAADAEDLLHLWRYVGVVIGVDPELLPTGEASARELWDLVTGSQAPPDADARALAAALLETPLAQARTAEQRKKAEGMVRVSYTLSRFLLGDEAADALGYPRYRAGRLLAALPLALGPAHDALRRTPFGAHWLAAAGHRHWANVVEQSLAGRPATFAMPEVVAAGGAAAKPPRP
jgi:hypothetical protein